MSADQNPSIGLTFARNPAKSQVNVLRYASFYPKWPLILVMAIAISIVLTLTISLWFVLLFIVSVLVLAVYFDYIKTCFSRGDALPGLVVGVNPTRIVVWTDLAKGLDSYPVVKIIQSRISSIMGLPIREGLTLPLAATYCGLPQSCDPYWWDFAPRPLECATDDRDTLDRVAATFTDAEYKRLSAVLGELPSLEPGLYRLTDNGWKRFKEIGFLAIYRATRTTGYHLVIDHQKTSNPSWMALGNRPISRRFLGKKAFVGGVVLLCLQGATLLAISLGKLWMVAGPMTRPRWRVVLALGGVGSGNTLGGHDDGGISHPA